MGRVLSNLDYVGVCWSNEVFYWVVGKGEVFLMARPLQRRHYVCSSFGCLQVSIEHAL